MGKGISRFFTESLLMVTKWVPMKLSEAPESIRVFAGTPLMIMVVNIGGGFGPMSPSSLDVILVTAFCWFVGVDNALVSTFGTLLFVRTSRNVLPSIFELGNRRGGVRLTPGT